MVSVSGLNTTLSIVEGAASVLASDNTAKLINRTAGAAGRVAMAGSALTAWTSQTTILSRMFIDESLLGEPVLPHLTKTLHEWYAAQIISALQLSQMVDGYRTVQDMMGVVQTGHNQRARGIIGNIAMRRIGQESFLENYHGESFTAAANLGLEDFGLESMVDTSLPNDVPKSKHSYDATSVRPIKGSENRIGPMGELFEVKLSNPSGNGTSVTVPLFVQMQPSIVPSDIAARFVDMNVPMPIWQRWTMMQAGEMTFWKDFVFYRDSAKRHKALLKDPVKAAAFQDYLGMIAKKDKYALDDATDNLSARQSSNLANSVMVLSEDALSQAKIDSGIDLHNPRDRARYFKNTYTMILVVIDPLHQRVTAYFNGLDGEVNNSYSDFRPNSKDFNPQEMMAAMQAFSTNNISRMR